MTNKKKFKINFGKGNGDSEVRVRDCKRPKKISRLLNGNLTKQNWYAVKSLYFA
jgi:hypothetical protein